MIIDAHTHMKAGDDYLKALVDAERAIGADKFVTFGAERIAVARAIERRRAEKRADWRRLHGDAPIPEEELRVDDAEVDRPFPFLALLIALDAIAVGALLLIPGRATARSSAAPLGIRQWGWPLAAGALSLAVCGIFF